MGLIEQIEAENMKESVPAFNVGDTVKVGYRIMRAAKSVSRTSKASSSPRRTAGSARRLRCAAFPSAWAWSAASPCIPPRSRTSTSCAPGKSAARSSTICAGLREKPPRSRKRSNFPQNEKSPIRLKSEADRLFCLRARAPQGLSAKNLLFFRKIALKTVYNRRVIG